MIIICMMEKIKQIWNWIKGLFKKHKPETEVIDEKPELVIPLYTIEHYPLGRAYYPKYGDDYLRLNIDTGIVDLIRPNIIVSPQNSKEAAIALIEKHKKQQSQETKIIIQYGG